ncbi:MAG: hypothetical protein PGMFKBFP_02549 [Anaerolineales bacterium]|jgi:hypothetical protein|nr:hypothetical protein [Anaerolineales bacterium]MBW7918947.1 hypothetical protein [Anaerolineales bacterium]MCZ2288441.1 hypothetical protein [Anaerolineales bacterium]
MDITPLHTKVEKIVQLIAGTVMLEDPKGFPRAESNLYFVQLNGKTAWQAEKPTPDTLYSRVRLNDDGLTLSTYTLDGHSCELDLQTGKILSQTTMQ